MQTILIVVGAVLAAVAVWLIVVAVWMKKKNLIGSWVAALPDGTHVTMQFEGERKGGIYKQISEGDTPSREFGHWTLNLTALKLIIMASDEEDHPRFGVDTQYWITWVSEDGMIIDGPDRPKWTFTRATEGMEIDFDEGAIGEPAAAPNGGPKATANSQAPDGPPSVS